MYQSLYSVLIWCVAFGVATPLLNHNARELNTPRRADGLSKAMDSTHLKARNVKGTRTTSSDAAVPTKMNVNGCHLQGTPTDLMLSHFWGTMKTSQPQECQDMCGGITPCISYSFQYALVDGTNNCVFYNYWSNLGDAVVPSNSSGIFFSNKYPSDGSRFCYG